MPKTSQSLLMTPALAEEITLHQVRSHAAALAKQLGNLGARNLEIRFQTKMGQDVCLQGPSLTPDGTHGRKSH